MKEQVKQLIKEGKTYKEISEITGLTKSTISYHANDNLKERVLNRQKELRRNIRTELLNYKGNKCSICGYDKCYSALEFHHTDPSKKDFGINQSRSTNLEKLKKEVDKCILLCSNCHREVHHKLRQDA